MCVFVCRVRASFTSIGQLLCCALNRIVDIMKVSIERNNMQVELIRFPNPHWAHSRPRKSLANLAKSLNFL